MKFKSFLKKLLLFSTIVVLVVTFCFYIFIENGAKYYFTENDRTELVNEIKTAPQLPDNFVKFYDVIYPGSLSNSTWNQFFKRINQQNFRNRNDCLSLLISIRFCIPYYKSYHSYNIFPPMMMSRFLEKNVTQQECLNYAFNKFDFLYKRKGIEVVSKNLFNKPLKDLKPIEMAEIIALYENPVKNDRFRNAESAKRRAAFLLEKYSENIEFNNWKK